MCWWRATTSSATASTWRRGCRLAEPGGILISGAVFEQVKNKLALGFDFLGPQAVKNIAEPVDAWRVVLDPDAGARDRPSAAPSAAASGRAAPPARSPWQRLRRSAVLAGVLIAFLLAINLLT